MRLKPPAHLILGFVRMGAKSGYAIKKAADVCTRFYWPTSLAQVYPELEQLQHQGLLTRRDDPQGARARSAYEVTDEGEAALRAWLLSTREAPVQFRDEGMLRLCFADALSREEQLTLVRRLRERDERMVDFLRGEIVPLAEALEERDTHFPAHAARLGADLYAFAAEWLVRLEAELEASVRDSAQGQRPHP